MQGGVTQTGARKLLKFISMYLHDDRVAPCGFVIGIVFVLSLAENVDGQFIFANYPGPTTPILDNFNRNDSATLGPNWSNGTAEPGASNTYENFQVNNQTLYMDAPVHHYDADYWIKQIFGQDQELYCTLVQPPLGNTSLSLMMRRPYPYGGISSTNSTGWKIAVFHDGLQQYYADGVVGSFGTTVGPYYTITWKPGDKLLLRMVNDTMLVWFSNASVGWSLIINNSSPKYIRPGYLGLYCVGDSNNISNGDIRIDDFGGGDINSSIFASPSANSPPFVPIVAPSTLLVSPSSSPSGFASPSVVLAASAPSPLPMSSVPSPTAPPTVYIMNCACFCC